MYTFYNIFTEYFANLSCKYYLFLGFCCLLQKTGVAVFLCTRHTRYIWNKTGHSLLLWKRNILLVSMIHPGLEAVLGEWDHFMTFYFIIYIIPISPNSSKFKTIWGEIQFWTIPFIKLSLVNHQKCLSISVSQLDFYNIRNKALMSMY